MSARLIVLALPHNNGYPVLAPRGYVKRQPRSPDLNLRSLTNGRCVRLSAGKAPAGKSVSPPTAAPAAGGIHHRSYCAVTVPAAKSKSTFCIYAQGGQDRRGAPARLRATANRSARHPSDERFVGAAEPGREPNRAMPMAVKDAATRSQHSCRSQHRLQVDASRPHRIATSGAARRARERESRHTSRR